jgi:hypothetical protein
MPELLADANAEGHLEALVAVCRSPDWIDIWSNLQIKVMRLRDLGLPPTIADDVLWRECQQRGLVLVTSNRNNKGPHSLSATIAREGNAHSLPVLTLADADRLITDRAYCRDAAVRLMEILDDLEAARGAGRLWLP